MKKNLQTVEKKNTALILKKSNMLLGITKKILSDKLVLKKTTDIVLNNKVWQDIDTGLVWQVDVDGKYYIWPESFEYAKRLNREKYGGYDDWRVPSKDELKTILTEEGFENEKSYTEKTYIKEPLLESVIKSSSNYYWSSSTYENYKNSAWNVNFRYGSVNYDYKASTYYVRCVRDGQ